MTDLDVEARLFRSPGVNEPAARAPVDFAWVHREMRRKGVTLQLLWGEYAEGVRGAGGSARAYQYSQFCEVYAAWRRTLSPTMRQTHRAGEKLFLDYSGKRPEIIDPETGEVREVELFVAVMGASPTGLGQPSLQFVKYEQSAFKVDKNNDNWTVGFYGDSGRLANLYGPNPNVQGRDFPLCIGGVKNPGYKVTNGYMPEVETFFLAPHAGTSPVAGSTVVDEGHCGLLLVVPALQRGQPHLARQARAIHRDRAALVLDRDRVRGRIVVVGHGGEGLVEGVAQVFGLAQADLLVGGEVAHAQHGTAAEGECPEQQPRALAQVAGSDRTHRPSSFGARGIGLPVRRRP